MCSVAGPGIGNAVQSLGGYISLHSGLTCRVSPPCILAFGKILDRRFLIMDLVPPLHLIGPPANTFGELQWTRTHADVVLVAEPTCVTLVPIVVAIELGSTRRAAGSRRRLLACHHSPREPQHTSQHGRNDTSQKYHAHDFPRRHPRRSVTRPHLRTIRRVSDVTLRRKAASGRLRARSSGSWPIVVQ